MVLRFQDKSISSWCRRMMRPSASQRSDGVHSAATSNEARLAHDVTTSPPLENHISTSFRYIPLQDMKENFRLMILDPATDVSSKICCQVLNSSLDDTCEYEALSYRWGLEQAENPILLRHTSNDNLSPPVETDAFEFYITLNLEAALRALRLPDQPRTLWIDSICIDQSNMAERNAQVALMGRIYRQCRRDLLWLGSATEQIQRAMGLIEKLSTCDKNEKQLSEFQDEDWSDIEAMIGANPVWSRVWIVQELYFAPEILLVCHGRSLEWDTVVKMIEDNEEFRSFWTVQADNELFRTVLRCFNNISTFHMIRHKESISQRLFVRTLLSVVLTFSSCEATKPVDKIYGVLNIAEDAEGLPIGYEKSLDEVSLDFAHHIITRNKSLLILSAALGNPFEYLWTKTKDEPPRTLPSWVMDISKAIPSVSGLTMMGQSPYDACGMMVEPMFRISPDGRCLSVGGWLVDRVGLLNTVSTQLDGETPRQRWIRDIHSWAPEDNMSRLYIPTNETFLNAYWRTIVADRNQDKRITIHDIEGPKWYERYQSLEERTVPDEPTMLPGWRFGMTKCGIFCMFPPAAKEGDIIAVLFGAKVPYLLRPVEQGEDEYKLVGEVYMHGFMDGQVLMMAAKTISEGGSSTPVIFNIL